MRTVVVASSHVVEVFGQRYTQAMYRRQVGTQYIFNRWPASQIALNPFVFS